MWTKADWRTDRLWTAESSDSAKKVSLKGPTRDQTRVGKPQRPFPGVCWSAFHTSFTRLSGDDRQDSSFPLSRLFLSPLSRYSPSPPLLIAFHTSFKSLSRDDRRNSSSPLAPRSFSFALPFITPLYVTIISHQLSHFLYEIQKWPQRRLLQLPHFPLLSSLHSFFTTISIPPFPPPFPSLPNSS